MGINNVLDHLVLLRLAISGVIQDIQRKQLLVEGLVTVIIILGGILVIGIALSRSNILQKQIEKKTRELQISEEQCSYLFDNVHDVLQGNHTAHRSAAKFHYD